MVLSELPITSNLTTNQMTEENKTNLTIDIFTSIYIIIYNI